jgi:hypothetical protein
MSATVRINGRVYELVDIADLAPDELLSLVDLYRRASRRWSRSAKRGRAKRRASRAIDAAILLLVRGLEPEVVRGLPIEAREAILRTAAESGVQACRAS